MDREERNEYDMHFMDIGYARSWLDVYNNEGDVADSKNREIVIIIMNPNSDAHVNVDEWSNYIYFNYFYKWINYYN